jgi:hypothetical protein
VKGLDREEAQWVESFLSTGGTTCEGRTPHFVTSDQWTVLYRLMERGIFSMYPCPTGAKHQHFALTALGREAYALAKLAGASPPKP